ncbi:MAG: DUF2064 domain-containing protein [Wenzhouxiangella sp.]|nr:DUF2064 domain-containing protein [Wenzhouxiangella sp.]
MTAAAIFVKTPGLSPLKTRLARDIGQAKAERWYLQAAAAVAELAQAAGLDAVYWAVAEANGQSYPAWTGLPCLPQGNGKLGARMARVHNTLVARHGASLLLGADAPQIDPEWLRGASQWLDKPEARLCLGPARDGGVWTFGANLVIDQVRWCSVNYSRADTCSAFKRAMSGLGVWQILPALTDVDEAGDLTAMAAELTNLTSPLPRQRQLLTAQRESQAED